MPHKPIISYVKKNTPLLMGVLNVTPDSFSDGGEYSSTRQAVQHALNLYTAGASIVDIGGESSRPGAKPVPLVEELRRVIPVIIAIRKKTKAYISIDTTTPEVAATALRLGADIVNDISGLRNSLMRKVVAKERCPVVLMHMAGRPGTMQKNPRYKNVVQDIIQYFKKHIQLAEQSGIKREQIILDPGIGFGKTVQHNITILKNIQAFTALGLPVLIGASRKSFIGKLTGADDPADRLPGTLAVHLGAAQQGAHILRVHDVAEHVQALAMQKYLR